VKTKIKGIIVAAFFGIILVTSTVAIALSGMPQQNPLEKVTITGTPADNFPDLERPRFCGTQEAKFTQYVREYKIPTECTQPLAITVDPQGNVWFAQTNTGMMAKFDPNAEQFTEYENPDWPEMGRSMFWGIDYSYDGNVLYTDDTYDSIWKFSTLTGDYERIGFPSAEDSLPQHLKVAGNQIIVNDFYGGKISFFDTQQQGEEKLYRNVPSPIPESFVGGFDIDSHGNIWYTNWVFRQGGALVKFDYMQFSESGFSGDNVAASQFSEAFNLPSDLGTPIGLSVDQNDNIWIADTSSSSFFRFDQTSETFTKYVTSDPRPSAYGNATGVIKTPVTGPYWTQAEGGKLIFNEQIANAIAVFDIDGEWLVEYQVPSQNPTWADCGTQSDCGIAQVFGFRYAGDKIWFTEWVENNIGVVDLTQDLPFEFGVTQKQLTIPRGQTANLDLQLVPVSNTGVILSSKTTAAFYDLTVQIPTTNLSLTETQIVPVSITASQSALTGTYKVLVSARTNDITVSQFVTVTVTP
jgi:virginiamycin B lyase